MENVTLKNPAGFGLPDGQTALPQNAVRTELYGTRFGKICKITALFAKNSRSLETPGQPA